MRKHFLVFSAFFILAFGIRVWNLDGFMVHCDDCGWVTDIQRTEVSGSASVASVVASAQTYAPGQFFLGYPLWKDTTDFKQFLYRIRLPSAIAGGIAVGLFAVLLSFIWNGSLIGFLVPSLLFAFSVRSLIESKQGYSYSVSAPFLVLLGLALTQIKLKESKSFNKKFMIWISVGMIGAIGVWFNYQVLIPTISAVFIAGVLTLTEFPLKKDFFYKLKGKEVLGFFVAVMASFVVMRPMLRDHILPHVGAHRNLSYAAFDFPRWDLISGIGERISYFGKYVFETLYKLLGYGLTPIWPDALGILFFQAMTFVLILAWLFGIYSILRNAFNKKVSPVGLWAVLTLMMFFAGNLKLAFPLGASRHSYISIVPNLIVLSFALMSIKASKKVLEYITGALAVSLSVIFVYGFPVFERKTHNRFDVNQVAAYAKQISAKYVTGTHCSPFVYVAQKLSKDRLFPGMEVDGDITTSEEFALKQLKRIKHEPGFSPAIVTSHRGDPRQMFEPLIKKMGGGIKMSLTTLIPAQGSTELIGDVNGGNAFAILRLDKI